MRPFSIVLVDCLPIPAPCHGKQDLAGTCRPCDSLPVRRVPRPRVFGYVEETRGRSEVPPPTSSSICVLICVLVLFPLVVDDSCVRVCIYLYL